MNLVTINKDGGYRVFSTISVPTHLVKSCSIQLNEPLFGLIKEINTMIYFFENREDFKHSYNHFDYGGGLVENETIVLIGYGVQGNILHEKMNFTKKNSL